MVNDDYLKLNEKYCIALDAILMKCCECQGYSRQSKHALIDVRDCVNNDCHLHSVRHNAITELYGDLDSYLKMLSLNMNQNMNDIKKTNKIAYIISKIYAL